MRFPHPLTLLLAAVAIAAVLTWILPAGEFVRVEHPETGREVVQPGSYHAVEGDPVGPFEALVALPRGMIEAADVIFLVFLVGGAFMVIDRTGAFQTGLDRLVRALGRHELLIVPVSCFAFGLGGVLMNMQEEFIALIPVLLLLTARLGFGPTVAVAMSLGAAAVGASFSPINPFQVGIAQRVADVELLSGAAYRIAFLVLALALWSWGTMRVARRHERGHAAPVDATPHQAMPMTPRHAVILLLTGVAFAVYVYGAMRLDWGFNEMSAAFFLLGVAAGIIGRLGAEGTAEAYVEGFKAMAFAAILIGFARAIFVVLADGRVVDTIVHGLFQPLDGLPRAVAGIGMMGVHTLIHVPVPSVSGQAVLTMPILAPLSDLLGFSRQVAVLAYQYGAGLCDLLTPTNGALMAVLAAARVRYEDWLRFAVPLWAMLFVLGAVSVLLAILLGVR